MKNAICAAACGLFLCAGLLGASGAAAGDLPADLAKAVHEYDQAQINGDPSELERLLADDYTLINSAGAAETKAQFISESVGVGNKLDPFTIEQPVEKIWSDGAIMGGVARLTGLSGGTHFAVTLRFTDVWAKREGKWRVVYSHASRVPAS